MNRLKVTFMILTGITMMISSCGDAQQFNAGSSAVPVSYSVAPETFKINTEDILNVTVARGENEPVTGVIEKAADIEELSKLLNNAIPLSGPETADYYRLLKIHFKHGSELSLEFGGRGRFFKRLDTGLFFQLNPQTDHKISNELIDRVEEQN